MFVLNLAFFCFPITTHQNFPQVKKVKLDILYSLSCLITCIHCVILHLALKFFFISNKDIQLVKFPPVVRKRGRPKGSDLTVIGLPAKRRRNATSGCYKSRPVPFIKKHPLEKDKSLFSYFSLLFC